MSIKSSESYACRSVRAQVLVPRSVAHHSSLCIRTRAASAIGGIGLALLSWFLFYQFSSNEERSRSSIFSQVMYHCRQSSQLREILGEGVHLEPTWWWGGTPWWVLRSGEQRVPLTDRHLKNLPFHQIQDIWRTLNACGKSRPIVALEGYERQRDCVFYSDQVGLQCFELSSRLD